MKLSVRRKEVLELSPREEARELPSRRAPTRRPVPKYGERVGLDGEPAIRRRYEDPTRDSPLFLEKRPLVPLVSNVLNDGIRKGQIDRAGPEWKGPAIGNDLWTIPGGRVEIAKSDDRG